MKLLLEHWRQYLVEAVDPRAETAVAKPKEVPEADEYTAPYKHEYESPREYSREQYFGKNPDELQCVIDLRHPKVDVFPPDFYRCMEDYGYQKLGAGSFRAVFTVLENPELVLKIVGPANSRFSDQKRAMEMNRKEALASFQTASDLIPKVYDSANDHFWIISEKVVPINTWKEMQTFFPVWRAEDSEEFIFYFEKLIEENRNEEDLIGTIDRRIEYVKMGAELVNDPLILQIRDLLAQFDLPAWDIRPHNVGYAVRNGKKQFVILDPGFELKKDLFGAQEEQPGESEEFEALFKDKYAATVPKKPNIMENWRHLIKESRGPKDFHYKITQSTKKIAIQPLNLQTKELEPGKAEGSAKVNLEKRTDIPYWQLAWSNSPEGTEGVGTIMYLIALELAGNNGLSPDDYEQSDDALRIWAKFMPEKNRFGVSKQKKEEFAHEGDDKPFFFVFFKPQNTILNRFSKQISYEQGREEEKPQIGPEERPFDPEDPEEWEFLDDLQEEGRFQRKVKKKHRRMKFRLIGKGKNKHNVGNKMKKPSYKRSKSAPPGAGGT